ncbi:amino acid ABC transporter permease [Spirochaeta cellobiosiphila]|uniref:amino acid ABC transporter permease n=1 Tax=Spirochaeta cellobiosiphila TaxID=504483 RepID=UPI0004175CC3|nr:ABC transporter permease subunit [Spirochaeta cellobiosiphila]
MVIHRRIKQILLQAVLIAIVVGLAVLFLSNYIVNISSRNIDIGFGFLDDEAGFSISQTLIKYDESDTFGRTFFVGVLNTLLASVIGIILAVVLGFFVGLMRLSKNTLLSQVAYGYTELLKNIPPLLHVLFWYQVVFLNALPDFKQSIKIGSNIYINVRGITIPEFHTTNLSPAFLIITFLAILTFILMGYMHKRMVLRGNHFKMWPLQVAVIAVPLLFWFLFHPYTMMIPIIDKFKFSQGATIRPELFSIVVALGTYTSTYIADIVRSSIIAVPKGQLEAAKSLGFNPVLRLRLIIVPQAMHTMIPPMTNQFLNIIKNTSLGMAIAYPDLTAVFAGTTLNQTGRALEVMIIVMLTYLLISVSTSLFMNWYNGSIINKKGNVLTHDEIEKIGLGL